MAAVFGSYGVVIVGSGPAGLAPLFAAATEGRLGQLLSLGVLILERSESPGAGALDNYAIRSDSSAETFLDIVCRTTEPQLQALAHHPIAQQVRCHGKNAVPLALVASFLTLAGRTMCAMVAASPRGRVLLRTEATAIQRHVNGRWMTSIRDLVSGVGRQLTSDAVVLAIGAHQPEARLLQNPVGGIPLLPAFRSKLIQSGVVLSHGGLEEVEAVLGRREGIKVTIIGGSTSAGAVAVRLLGRGSPLRFGKGDLTLMHRKPLHIFYDSIADAAAEGYKDFVPSDVCSITGKVFRLSGFRLDSRELIMSALAIGGRAPEPRLRLFQLAAHADAEAQRILQDSDLIVAALGYAPRTLPIRNASGLPVPLCSPDGPSWAIVDQGCRLMTAAGEPLSNLFAIGLAVGPAPAPDLGGEVGFRGQVNSLWMWQHTLGIRVVNGIFTAAQERGRDQLASALSPATMKPAAIAAGQRQMSRMSTTKVTRWA